MKIFLLLNDLCLVTTFLFVYYSISKPIILDAFLNTAMYGYQKFNYRNKQVEPWYSLERVWRNAIILMGFLGVVSLSYNTAKNFLAWLPLFHVPAIQGISTFGIFVGFITFVLRAHELALKDVQEKLRMSHSLNSDL